tara:strand:- start:9 stop:530 length:522 start_codon:yes stop_codon:yes gene_type:complete
MCGANAMMVASAALQVGTAVLDYQNKKALAKQKTADNQVAMGHYNESYLNDLSKIDNESGNAQREKAVEEFRIKQLKAKDMATALNAGFGNPFRVVQDISGAADLDYNYIGFQYNKDMVTLQNQENEAYAHMVKGYSSLTSATQPSLLGTGLQIAAAGVNYRTEDLKRRGEWK